MSGDASTPESTPESTTASTLESARRSARFSYPVFLDLDEVPVLVVGGGRIGARKAAALAEAGARVRLVAAEVSEHVTAIVAEGLELAEVHERPFDPADLDGVRLVITATGDMATDAEVSRQARDRGIWTNAADQPVDCEFILPAIARAGRVTVAVSTDGASPALAGVLRDRFAEVLTDDVGEYAELLAAQRAEVKASGASTEDIDWRPAIRARLDALAPSDTDS